MHPVMQITEIYKDHVLLRGLGNSICILVRSENENSLECDDYILENSQTISEHSKSFTNLQCIIFREIVIIRTVDAEVF